MPGLSYEQMMRVPQILKLYERLKTPSSFFQRLLKVGPTDTPGMVSQQNTFGYDVYNATRTMSTFTAPMAPPTPTSTKPISTETATLFRTHPMVTIADGKVFATRTPGNFGINAQVDATGQRYISTQVKHVKTMIDNSVEWMVAKMLQGGFGYKAEGDGFRLCELNDPDIIASNTYRIPSTNKGDINGIIDNPWSDPTTNIQKQLLLISKRSAQISGYPIKHIICNGETIIPLFTNNIIRQVGGEVYRVFDSITNRQVKGDEPLTSGEYTVIFRALPQYVFHVYNEGLVPDEVVPNYDEQTSDTNFKLLVPNNRAIMIPEPGDWCTHAVGQEIVAENVMDSGKLITGFHAWRTRNIDPPRWDMKFVLNYVPLLVNPYVVYYADTESNA